MIRALLAAVFAMTAYAGLSKGQGRGSAKPPSSGSGAAPVGDNAGGDLVGGLPERMPSRELLARTIWGEARGESYEGMLAVGEVMMNRLRTNYRGKRTIQDVILDPYQFSAWLASDPNRSLMLAVGFAAARFSQAWKAAGEVLDGARVLGADDWRHYYNPDVASPSWAKTAKETRKIGNHLFARGVL